MKCQQVLSRVYVLSLVQLKNYHLYRKNLKLFCKDLSFLLKGTDTYFSLEATVSELFTKNYEI